VGEEITPLVLPDYLSMRDIWSQTPSSGTNVANPCLSGCPVPSTCDCRPFYVPTCGRARIRATGGAIGAFSASSRDRKMRKTLRMLIPSACAASPLVLPASTKAKTCSALARAVGMPPRYLPSAFALAMPSSCRASQSTANRSASEDSLRSGKFAGYLIFFGQFDEIHP
jgi:hypothetical protein